MGKCKVLHLGSRNPRYDYNMGDLILEAATEEKDLDVIIDEKLKFDKHTEAHKSVRQTKSLASSEDHLKPWTRKPLCGFSKH